ncbi:aldo/keto reductase [Algoriphagus halophilus]|uniref:Predicted oxidoreductase n=1 Tax=Algoriphagus halophilus TaxID=226505 RepID=A0A1N6D8L8_9BACT|nr:aldo/keto reductase [Algoriphagus halophilus]SIN67125.1 Predicted oxidoreductase [Algoriphagus halophilus]
MNPNIELAENLKISRIVTGLWQIADMERDGNTLDPVSTSKYMQAYVDSGFTSFDMADHYGSSEIIAGTFKNSLSEKEKVQLFTKWVPKPGKITRSDVRSAIQTALDRMQQTSIDLLQFHAWYYPDPSWLDGLFYLNELKEEGLIQHLGVTNFDAAHLRIACASGIPIVSNQVCHSVIDQRATQQMKKVCDTYHVKLLAFGTLAGGFLTDRWVGKAEPSNSEIKTWSQMKYKRFIDAAGGWEVFQQLLQTLKQVAEKHQVSVANIAGRCILENPNVAAIIVGARLGESEHIEDNKKLLEINLQAEDLELIQEAQRSLTPIPGDCGDEYRKPPFLTASGDLSDHLETIPKAFTPIQKTAQREQIFSGTEWEEYAGYCRAVKDGNRIYISGTTSTHGPDQIGGLDPAAQTHFVIDKIEGVLTSFGGSLEDVVRTRIFVNEIKDWEPVARAHGERFKGINPANTLVEAKLVGEGYLVEIEAEAIISSAD